MTKTPKICLYLEFRNFLNGALLKKTGTGLLSAYNNQKKILKNLGIDFTEKWDKNCDILQVNSPWLKSLQLVKKARHQNKKVIIWTHSTAEDFKNAFRLSNALARPLKKYLTYFYGLADIMLCPSEYTKNILIGYGLPAEKIIVQSNGVDIKKFIASKEHREKGRREHKLDGPVFGCVGLVFPKRKGVDWFLDVAKKLPQQTFIWFGKIFNKIMVEALPKKLPNNVKFTGYVDDILAAYNAIDIFIFPSREENQGMAVLEAAAIGLPIIMRDIPVYEGWFFDGENCLKAKTPEQFLEQCEKLLRNPALREKLGQNAHKMALDHSIEKLAEKTMEIYRRLSANLAQA